MPRMPGPGVPVLPVGSRRRTLTVSSVLAPQKTRSSTQAQTAEPPPPQQQQQQPAQSATSQQWGWGPLHGLKLQWPASAGGNSAGDVATTEQQQVRSKPQGKLLV